MWDCVLEPLLPLVQVFVFGRLLTPPLAVVSTTQGRGVASVGPQAWTPGKWAAQEGPAVRHWRPLPRKGVAGFLN